MSDITKKLMFALVVPLVTLGMSKEDLKKIKNKNSKNNRLERYVPTNQKAPTIQLYNPTNPEYNKKE